MKVAKKIKLAGDTIARNPVMTASAVVPIIVSLLYLLEAFGVGLTEEQQEAIIGFASIVIPLLLAWWARSLVTPVDDPRNNEGEQLVTQAEAEASLGPVGGVR